MKVLVVGTRGFPSIIGGVETHCQELYPRLSLLGYNILVARRKEYINQTNSILEYKGVHFIDIPASKNKYFEAIYHTFLSIIRSRKLKADIVHIHGIGPGILAPLARLMGKKVLITVHSFNYDHNKWNPFAKFVLRIGELISVKFANRLISISKPIKESLEKRHNCSVQLIYNGVNKAVFNYDTNYLTSYGIGPKPYILALGRLTPEKGFHDLIEAFAQSGLSKKIDLVIAGSAEPDNQYANKLKQAAKEASVIMPGFVSGSALHQLLTHANLFVLPSYNEGLPIALLEALSYNLDVVVSDIEPNKLDLIDSDCFFQLGNIDALAEKLIKKALKGTKYTYDLSQFNWDRIAELTASVYDNL